MQLILEQFPELFSNNMGKFKGDPIKINVRLNVNPVVQPPRRIPLHYVDRLHDEIIKMVDEDIIEGPQETEEPGTYISNLVITDKKWDPQRMRVKLDCQQVNKDIYQTHEPIPTTEELQNKLEGRDRFSVIKISFTINSKLNQKLENYTNFDLQGGFIALNEWLWVLAQQAVRYKEVFQRQLKIAKMLLP